MFKKNLAEAAGTRVSSSLNNISDGWVGSVKIGSLNGDYYLWQETNETDPNYDDFAMQSNMELVAYNGAYNSKLTIWHDLPYSVDQVQDWSPKTSTGSSFQVSLPWQISWSWDTTDSVSVTTEGSQTYDNAKWTVDMRLWQLHLVNPCRFQPGTAWLSTGSLAAIDTQSEGLILYNDNWYPISQLHNYRYSY